MARNVDSKITQLLDESPNFGTAATNLSRYFVPLTTTVA
jgi:hypothetical protein